MNEYRRSVEGMGWVKVPDEKDRARWRARWDRLRWLVRRFDPVVAGVGLVGVVILAAGFVFTTGARLWLAAVSAVVIVVFGTVLALALAAWIVRVFGE